MSALPDFDSDTLPIGHLEAQLDRWVDSFPVEAIQQHLAELQARKGTIDAAIESLTKRLQVWQAIRAHDAGRGVSVVVPTKRESVLVLLDRDPTREFSLAEIREYLVDCGLLENSARARHALEVTVSNMVRRGEIARPKRGFYALVSPGGR